MYASSNGHVEIVRFLLDRKASMNLQQSVCLILISELTINRAVELH